MVQNQKKSDPGISISIEVSRGVVNDLVRETKGFVLTNQPLLIPIGLLVLAVLGFQAPKYLNGPEPPVPLPTEIQK